MTLAARPIISRARLLARWSRTIYPIEEEIESDTSPRPDFMIITY
jgi:hypothetical protein